MKKTRLVLLLILLILMASPALAYPGINQNPTYIFSENAAKITIPDCFSLDKIITITDPKGNVIANAEDLFVSADQHLYVLDSAAGRILIYNESLQLERIMDHFILPDGSTTTLNKPMGLFVTNAGIIYVADTKNERILQMDQQGIIQTVTNKPASFQGTDFSTFNPSKLVVDSIGRITVVAQNINMGLLQFDPSGDFTGYMGAPKVKVDALTKLWKKLSTDAQKAQMQQFVPTEYSNLAMDAEGFIYGTISSVAQADAQREMQDTNNSGNAAPVRKLNSMGTDILKRNGRFSPIGNQDLTVDNTVSRMIDVAIGPGDSYTLLDSRDNLLYTYSEDGVLLCVFGGKGKDKASFERPVSIVYLGKKLLVLDAALSQIMVFSPTDYYQVVIDAVVAKHEGNYELEYEKWAEIARQNTNFEYAYTGLGKVAHEEGDYLQAMEYFEYASDKKNYSESKEKNRKEYMTQVFPILFGIIAVIIVAWSIIGIVRKMKAYFEGVKR